MFDSHNNLPNVSSSKQSLQRQWRAIQSIKEVLSELKFFGAHELHNVLHSPGDLVFVVKIDESLHFSSLDDETGVVA